MTELDRRRLERQPLWTNDPARYETVLGILYRHDLMRLVMPANPKAATEYVSEVNQILPRLPALTSIDEVHSVVYEVFCGACSGSERAGRPERYLKIAEEIWSEHSLWELR